jgi:hypothetical protein
MIILKELTTGQSPVEGAANDVVAGNTEGTKRRYVVSWFILLYIFTMGQHVTQNTQSYGGGTTPFFGAGNTFKGSTASRSSKVHAGRTVKK